LEGVGGVGGVGRRRAPPLLRADPAYQGGLRILIVNFNLKFSKRDLSFGRYITANVNFE
jgi:hypothetical protein